MSEKVKPFTLWLLILFLPSQLGKHFWYDWSYVWGVKIDYLSPVIYLSDIFLLINLILFRKEIFRKINFRQNQSRIIPFLLFVVFNSFFAESPLVAFFKWQRIFLLFGFYYLVKAQKKKIVGILKNVIPTWITVLFFIALLQIFFQSSLGGMLWWLGERSFSLDTPGIAKTFIFGRFYLRPYTIFSHPNSLAGFCLVSLMIYLVLVEKLSARKTLLALLTFLLIVLTLSRSAMIAAIGILVWWLLKNKSFFSAFFSILILLFALIILGAGPSFVQRIDLALASLEMFIGSPFAGVGANNFIVSLPEYWRPNLLLQPVHNIFLLVLAETGMVGLVYFLKAGLNFLKGRYYLPFLAILITGLFDHYWLTLIQNMLLLSLVLALSSKDEN